METGRNEAAESSDHPLTARRMHRLGRVASALPVIFLLFDGATKVAGLAPAVDGTVQLGYPGHLVVPIGAVLLVCTLLYVLPRTAIVGAVLLTGYLGGAAATQVRVESWWFLFPVLLGALLWAGLYLRDGRLRTLVRLPATGGSDGEGAR